MKDRQHNQSNASRPATVLLSFCILVLVSVWLLNASIHKGRKDYYSGLGRLDARATMVNKLQAYRAKNQDFFHDIIADAIGLRRTTFRVTSEFGFRPSTIDFAERAVAIFAERSDVEGRKAQLLVAMRSNFHDEDEVPTASFSDLAEKLSVIDLPEEWPSVAYWIVFDLWPKPRYEERESGEDTVSYTNRYTRVWGFTEEDKLLNRRLVAEGEKNAEALLSKEYLETANRLATASRNLSAIGMPGLGISIPVGDLLFFVGPTLVALAAVFLVVRERDLGTCSKPTFSFPQYGSPNDPLFAMRPCTVVDYAQRVLWSAFLVLPLLLLITGVVFRYDVATPLDQVPSIVSLVPTAIDLKASDSVDNVLDGVNLICLGIVLVFVHTLTARPDKAADLTPYRKWSDAIRMGSLGVGVSAAAVVIYFVFFRVPSIYDPGNLHSYPGYCMAVFALILLAGVCLGIHRRLRFITLVCIVILVALSISLLAGRGIIKVPVV